MKVTTNSIRSSILVKIKSIRSSMDTTISGSIATIISLLLRKNNLKVVVTII